MAAGDLGGRLALANPRGDQAPSLLHSIVGVSRRGPAAPLDHDDDLPLHLPLLLPLEHHGVVAAQDLLVHLCQLPGHSDQAIPKRRHDDLEPPRQATRRLEQHDGPGFLGER